ncbi:MAG: hypothetical protein ACRDO1_00410 [Nocardioidaceae bacterium]
MNLLRRRGVHQSDSEPSRVVGRLPLPSLPGPVAAAAVGLLCAVLAMLMVLLGELGCDVVRGTPSCGGFGVVLLVATGALMLLVGMRLLAMLDVADPGVTSLLGLSLFAIVLMSALIDRIFDASMWFVLPALGAVAYAAAAWLAGALSRTGDGPG